MKKISQVPLFRILTGILVSGAGVLAGQIILNLLRSTFSITDTAVANLLALLLITPAVYFAYRFFVRTVEKRDVTELSRTKALREFGLGSLMGFGLFSTVIAVLGLMGIYRVTGSHSMLLPVIGALAGAFVSAFVQELMFRGVIYRITEEWLGLRRAVAISAALFSLIHGTEAGATIFSTVTIALQAGLILAAAYALTGRIWMAFGLHMMWDFAQDGIFGIGLAGQSGGAIPGLLQAGLNGPRLLTGGPFGVEASVVSLAVTLIAGIILLRKAIRNNRLTTQNKQIIPAGV
jgi:hypothetical protein